MILIDSHCHPNLDGLSHRIPDILADMQAADVALAVAVSVDRKTAGEVLALAEKYPQFYATVGVHPEDAEAGEMSFDELTAAARHPKVVAIGETGLDYFHHQGDPAYQHERFAVHIRAANAAGLPVVVHTRDAEEDTLAILRGESAQAGVIHCFTGDTEFARKALDLGFYISFSGIVTFKSATDIQAACRFVPADRILLETDAPFLAPVPKRGKTNEPAFVRYTAEFVAGLRRCAVEEIAAAATANTLKLFSKLPNISTL